MIRTLKPGDEAQLDRFLQRHADSSLFLRANALAAGLLDQGHLLQATYVARYSGNEATGVVAHAWNGNLLLQAPADPTELARRAVEASGRAIAGILGPWQQATTVLKELSLEHVPASVCRKEDLFAVNLAELRVPDVLTSGACVCRLAEPEDFDLLSRWRTDFLVDAIGAENRPELLASCRQEVVRGYQIKSLFVLSAAGQLVSTCGFNARHPACVQVGAVWTPPPFRSRGYARAVVAGALQLAHADGIARSVLFTGEDNTAAKRAYTSIGYQRVGDYGLILFRAPHRYGTKT